jgi:predicted permease
VLQPAITWFLATSVFSLSPLLTHTAVLLAALPTGAGPFMLAEFYRREAGVTSNVVLSSTVLSLFTISAYLAVAV